jgi:hypothetical protein
MSGHFPQGEEKPLAGIRERAGAHGLGKGTLGVSSPDPALCAGRRLYRDTASKIPVSVVFASTNKVTQLTTNGTDNRVHNVAPSFIIIKWMGVQRHTQIVDP